MCSHHTLAPAELRREAKVVRKFWVALARLHQILDDLKIALTRSIVQRCEAFHVCAIEILVRQLSAHSIIFFFIFINGTYKRIKTIYEKTIEKIENINRKIHSCEHMRQEAPFRFRESVCAETRQDYLFGYQLHAW